jgi:hypothetical protein
MWQIILAAGSGILFGFWLPLLGATHGITYLKERAI